MDDLVKEQEDLMNKIKSLEMEKAFGYYQRLTIGDLYLIDSQIYAMKTYLQILNLRIKTIEAKNIAKEK